MEVVRKDLLLHLILVVVLVAVVRILSVILLEAVISHKEASMTPLLLITQLHQLVGDTYIIEVMYTDRENEKYIK